MFFERGQPVVQGPNHEIGYMKGVNLWCRVPSRRSGFFFVAFFLLSIRVNLSPLVQGPIFLSFLVSFWLLIGVTCGTGSRPGDRENIYWKGSTCSTGTQPGDRVYNSGLPREREDIILWKGSTCGPKSDLTMKSYFYTPNIFFEDSLPSAYWHINTLSPILSKGFRNKI